MKNYRLLFLEILWILFICIGITRAQGYSFSADSVLNTGYILESILSENFNNDNYPDLAVAMRDDANGHHVAIYLNDGFGVFNNMADSIYYVGDFLAKATGIVLMVGSFVIFPIGYVSIQDEDILNTEYEILKSIYYFPLQPSRTTLQVLPCLW